MGTVAHAAATVASPSDETTVPAAARRPAASSWRMGDASGEWLALPYAEWRDTRDTLAHVHAGDRQASPCAEPLRAGLGERAPLRHPSRATTSPVPFRLRSFDAEFDLHDHSLLLRTGDGQSQRRPLGGPVADFYSDVMEALRRMGIDVSISVIPSEVPDPIPFPEDRTHATYDAAQVRALSSRALYVDLVMKEHRAHFRGRTSPVHFFWGTFDLAVTRYSGRSRIRCRAQSHQRFSSDAEQICTGWWPGDHRVAAPTFFSYAHPGASRHRGGEAGPPGAAWSADAGEFLFPYDAALHPRIHAAPSATFLTASYGGAAKLLGWNPDLTTSVNPLRPPVIPRQGVRHERSLRASRPDPRRRTFGTRLCRMSRCGAARLGAPARVPGMRARWLL